MKTSFFTLKSFSTGVALILVFFQFLYASEPSLLPLPETDRAFSAFDNSASEVINPGDVYIRQLKGGEKHLFIVKAKKGACLRFVFEQKGIDIMIAVKKKTENQAPPETLKKVDRPSGSFGRETVTFLTPETDNYYIEITAWLADAIDGKYQFSYSEEETSSLTDHQRSLAEDLTSEAELLRSEGTRENKEKGLQVFAEALKVWQELGEVYEQAIVFYGMGYTHYGLSNNYEAARLYNRALKLHLQIGDEFGEAVNYAALGAIKYTLNDNEISAFYYKNAIDIYKKVGNVRGLGIAYHGLGTEQMLSGKYDEAIESLTESLRWRVLANDSKGKAYTHITLGKLYLFNKAYVKGGVHLLEAEKALGEKRSTTDSDLLYNFGKYYFLMGDLEKSRNFLEQSRNLSAKKGDHLGVSHCLIELSRIHARSGDYKTGLNVIDEAVNIVEKLRISNLDFRARINFSAAIQPFYEQNILLLMKLNELYPGKGFDVKALQASDHARARGLLDQLERRQFIRQNQIPSELLERERKIRDELTKLLSVRTDSKENKLTAQFLNASTDFTEIEAEINRRFSSPETVTLPELKLNEIRDQLSQKTVILEYWITDQESYVFVISKKEVKSFKLADGTLIDKAARRFYECVSIPPTSLSNEKICRQQNSRLSKLLLSSLNKEIQNKNLIVIKQGFLHYIPFSSLTDPETGKYLVETSEIKSLPAISIMNYLPNSNTSLQEKSVAVFADPIYSSGDGRIPLRTQNVKEDDMYLPRLFASRFEAEAIKSHIKSKNFLLAIDSEANRQNVFKLNLKNYQIIHFAAHFLANDENPELSAIALSFYDKNGLKQNGHLRSNDILRLDLDAELVVLSSCRSGTGKQIKGEGLISLANVFFAAGTNHLLSSLWEVDDKVTAELMKKFYKKHLAENKPISVALRESQIEILQDKRWQSPFYWSAFSIQGSSN